MNEFITLEESQTLIDMMQIERQNPDQTNLDKFADEYGYLLSDARDIVSFSLASLLNGLTKQELFEQINGLLNDENPEDRESFLADLREMLENNDKDRLRRVIKIYLMDK